MEKNWKTSCADNSWYFLDLFFHTCIYITHKYTWAYQKILNFGQQMPEIWRGNTGKNSEKKWNRITLWIDPNCFPFYRDLPGEILHDFSLGVVRNMVIDMLKDVKKDDKELVAVYIDHLKSDLYEYWPTKQLLSHPTGRTAGDYKSVVCVFQEIIFYKMS